MWYSWVLLRGCPGDGFMVFLDVGSGVGYKAGSAMFWGVRALPTRIIVGSGAYHFYIKFNRIQLNSIHPINFIRMQLNSIKSD